jgi:hypothetical protein
LLRPPVTDRDDPVFQDARLQPFLDQADDAPVADPVLQETDQPLLTNRVKGSGNTLPISTIIRIM